MLSVGALTRRLIRAALIAGVTLPLLAGCQSEPNPPGTTSTPTAEATSQTPTPTPVTLVVGGVTKPLAMKVDAPVQLTTAGGTLTSVKVTSGEGRLAGTLENGTWTPTERLEPGTTYRVTVTAVRDDGTEAFPTGRFRTEKLPLSRQTYASIAPMNGETVGVGMPVIVKFDVPVTDRAKFEEHMHVTTKPTQAGTWYWISDYEAHYRPKVYWKPGTRVGVNLDINSIPAGNGVYGQENRNIRFRIGDAHIYKVNADTHQMKVYSNNQLLRTIPITTGKPGFTTRSGIKVIIEKFASKRMNSETVGIPSGSADAYDIDNVQWAMRVTFSGEFVHAAPWSVGSQGYANVSHGCTGMSTSNAEWLYAMSRRGDVVEYVGTDRPMTLTNGYGDWNLPWRKYQTGSAL